MHPAQANDDLLRTHKVERAVLMHPVVSSQIKRVGYIAELFLLVIDFESNRRYEHYGVPAHLHRDLLRAESIGSYYNRIIKGKFSYREVQING